MTELLTAAQMRAIEAAAIASGEVTGLELMERAGRGVVAAIFEEWPELAPPPGALPRTPEYFGQDETTGGAASPRAVVLCGPGNNGGDGFVVARLLKAWGWEVEVFLYGDPEKLPPDARVNYERWLRMGEVRSLSMPTPTAEETEYLNDRTCVRMDEPGPAVIIDALFGVGLTRPVCNLTDLLEKTQLGDPQSDDRPPYVVAVDVPSGVCADSGRILGEHEPGAVGAHLTVTFHAAKHGHFLSSGSEMGGRLRVADIGLRSRSEVSLKALARLHGVEASDRRQVRRGILRELVHCVGRSDWGFALDKATTDHKFSHGHALILSGTHGRAGAARLAARGALRIGAGLVTVASPPAAMAENAARLDAIMLREVAGGEGLAGVLADRRINALCLGPGMGAGARQAELLAVALDCPPPPSPPHGEEGGRPGQGADRDDRALPLPPVGRGEGWGARPLVLDADALTLLSRHPSLFAALHGSCILTPHAGEFARLFPDIAGKLSQPATKGPAYSKVDATREAAARAGCVVLFKGPDTVIADPAGRAAINAAVHDRAAPWLATAGSGDVLAGFITGLLARGFSPFDAACTGAWLHVECARAFGPGLIAEDLPEQLPKVFRALGL